MKHTPGPWHANTPLREEDCTDVTIREPKNGDIIATVAAGKANARLIAAAPTYYAIVEAILTDETLTAEHIRNMLRPVQAKAKGE